MADKKDSKSFDVEKVADDLHEVDGDSTKVADKLAESAPKSVDQNEALLKYKVTGHVGDYVDPTRDQEADISPKFGQAPHPELANPEPEGTPPLGAKVPSELWQVAAFDPNTQEPRPTYVDPAQDSTQNDTKVSADTKVTPDKTATSDQNDSKSDKKSS